MKKRDVKKKPGKSGKGPKNDNKTTWKMKERHEMEWRARTLKG